MRSERLARVRKKDRNQADDAHFQQAACTKHAEPGLPARIDGSLPTASGGGKEVRRVAHQAKGVGAAPAVHTAHASTLTALLLMANEPLGAAPALERKSFFTQLAGLGELAMEL